MFPERINTYVSTYQSKIRFDRETGKSENFTYLTSNTSSRRCFYSLGMQQRNIAFYGSLVVLMVHR